MRLSVEETLEREWDVLVVGTGMGGATLGWSLARAGRSVLFLERGASEHPRTGLLDTPIRDESGPLAREWIPLLGSGPGGSCALFGMLMERFLPEDFAGSESLAGDEDSLDRAAWPIDYAELEPFYEAAERLYRVRGEADPLRGPMRSRPGDPPRRSEWSQRLAERLASKGLHPYQPPMACEFLEGCGCCQGFLCPRPCKNDAARRCLGPSLAKYDAQLLSGAPVLALRASASGPGPGPRVDRVVCRVGSELRQLRARVVILSAGALETPRILLASESAAWPRGLANTSGLVGAHLMRHLVDLYALQASGVGARPHKEIAFNDLYRSAGPRLGAVQALGPSPASSLGPPREGTADSGLLLLASVLEDAARPENRVLASGQGGPLRLRYRPGPSDRRRLRRIRQVLQELLGPMGFQLIPAAEANDNWGHVCGTCRFGVDPERSVLDRNNRAHDLENLYVVDASFFPSSGGVGPALTVAANALRVAEHIQNEWASG